MSTRVGWEAAPLRWRPEPGRLVHARVTGDELTLCERGTGRWLPPGGNCSLLIDHPETTAVERARVDCQECVEWMRA